ncbi:hypothetical protein Vadar_004026 [Vaccinium darrowii]|uniref:Uncharacterized protein n=1 Tax=Vaccinium darrowii TaxID=229202 RepID=A0ACB7YSX6_9ERIC|nr:hypothetical protein Vadar_004026 [Vaccinium darrowii]
MYKEVPSRVFLNLSSTSEPFPATIHGFNPMKHERVSEKGVMGGEKVNEEELAEKYKDEIDSWFSLNPESDDEQNNNGTSWGEVDKDLDIKEYNPCFENQYQVHYNPQQCYLRRGSTGSESLVPLSFAGASEQHQEQRQNFSSGMENEMSKAQFIHHPLRSQSVRS